MGKRCPSICEQGRCCAACKEFKVWADFNKCNSASTGYESSCKICRRKRCQEKRREKGVKPLRCDSICDEGRNCLHCNKFKFWSEFNKKRDSPYKREGTCRSCQASKLLLKRRAKGVKPRHCPSVCKEGRKCINCGEFKTWDKFYKEQSHYTKHRSTCKTCLTRVRYGKSIEDLKSDRCEICDSTENIMVWTVVP